MDLDDGQIRAKGLAIIFLLALLLRWTAIEVAGPRRDAFGDSEDYVAAARSICKGEGLPDRGNLPFFRAPLLPAFLALSTGCSTENIRGAQYLLAVCDSLTVVIIGALAFFF